jgi:hypothetical protein
MRGYRLAVITAYKLTSEGMQDDLASRGLFRKKKSL